MKKTVSVFLALLQVVCLLVTALPTQALAAASVIDSGTCGENLTWTLWDDGELTISGTGPMAEFSMSFPAPWGIYYENITSVTLEEGVTTVGSMAFRECFMLEKVKLPESLTAIGQYAFAFTHCLQEITIPANVTQIGDYAFQGCEALPEITIPAGVTTIGQGVFADCFALDAVELPSGLTSIGKQAFYDCVSLAEISIPAGVTNIGELCFAYCFTLTEVELPAGVTQIGDNAFTGCGALTGIWVSGENQHYSNDERGVLLNKEKTMLLRAPGAIEGSYTVPATVTAIDNSAFNSCHKLTEVILPAGLTQIGQFAFAGCEALEEAELPESLTTIENYAFSYCESLSEITIPAGVTTIGEGALEGCCSMTGIWVSSENQHFSNDEKGVLLNKEKTQLLRAPGAMEGSYEVPAGVNAIGNSAFYGCVLLAEVSIPAGVTAIGEAGFASCDNLKRINMPNSLTAIGEAAFSYCLSLSEITIPAGVTTISNGMFAGCCKLTDVTFHAGITEIGEYAFGECGSLTDITLPSGVTAIGSQAFESCYMLPEMIIPAGVTSIGSFAFNWCSNLSQVYFLGDAPAFGDIVFPDYEITVNFPKDNATWTEEVCQSFGSNIRCRELVGNGTCGQTTQWLLDQDGMLLVFGAGPMENVAADSAAPWYAHRSAVREVKIKKGVTAIGDYAFCGCENLERITVSGSVSAVGKYAFASNSSLREVYFVGNAPTFGENAFYNVVTTAYYPGNDITWTEEVKQNYGGTVTWEETVRQIVDSGAWGENLTWTLYDDRHLVISGTGEMLSDDNGNYPWRNYQYDIRSLEITDGVTSIGDRAFEECQATTVTLGKDVVDIGWYAFRGCSELTGLWVSPENLYFSNDTRGVLFNEDKTELVLAPGGLEGTYEIPNGVTVIADNAFCDCWKLSAVTIPHSVTAIERYAFYYCTNLTGISIPAGVAEIGTDVFEGCFRLTGIWVDENNANYSSDDNGALFDKQKRTLMRVPQTATAYTIPDSVQIIGNSAFSDCGSLTAVAIPDSVTVIEGYAFDDCRQLAEVIFGNHVTTIGDSAFSDCESLKTVTIPDSVTSLGDSVFAFCGLTDVYLGDGVTHVSYDMFRFCDRLTGIWVSEDHPLFTNDARGVLLSRENVLVLAPCGISGKYEIPEGIVAIGKNAFWGCDRLLRVSVGNDVETIGIGAFSNCMGLVSVTITDKVTTIEDSAFGWCYALQRVSIGNSVTTIGNSAFAECGGLKNITVGSGVKTVGERAFEGCWSLQRVNVGSSVTAIGNQAFRDCEELKEVFFSGNAPEFGTDVFQEVEVYAYYPAEDDTWTEAVRQNYGGQITWMAVHTDDSGMSYVEENGAVKIVGSDGAEGALVIPGEIDGKPVTGIAGHAFANIPGLTSVVIPGTVTEIGEYAFYNCPNLKRVTFAVQTPEAGRNGTMAVDNPVVIGSYAFAGCSGLNEIVFQGDAPEIEAYAFADVTATAYYPADNATWTEEVRQNYGGTITWVPVGGEEPEEPEMQWVQATLSLEGNIGINFYVTLNEVLVNDAETVMRFTINGESIDVPLAAAVLRDGKYIFTCPVSAKNMADDVTAQIFCSQGAVGDSRTLSVRYYAMYMINNSRNPAIVKLMKAMLNYGAAAQMSFSHNTGDLANKDLSEADKVLAEVDASAYVHSVSGSEAGIRASGITLVLETETAVRVLFTLDGSKTIDQYTFKVDGEVVRPQVWSGNVYFIEIPNIAAQDLDDIYNVTVGGLTVRYGGLSYVNQINNLATATQLQKDMAKALYAYWNGAENYFNSL